MLNCNVTGLFCKKIRNRAYITWEEKALAGHKQLKKRLTPVLRINISADLKTKTLLLCHFQTPRAFKKQNVNKDRLLVTGGSVQKLGSKGNNSWNDCMRCLYPPLINIFQTTNYWKGAFLLWTVPHHETSTSAVCQQVICNFKKLYRKVFFTKSFNITEKMSLMLQEF